MQKLSAIAVSAALLSACAPQGGVGSSTFLECDRGVRLQVDYRDGLAFVRVNGGPAIRLVSIPTASGTAYEGSGYALREHQGTVMWNGPTREAPYSCRQVLVPR
jgi:hypothetical protein